jgi:FlaA1/EpsC-like NDP-sugar epimerase
LLIAAGIFIALYLPPEKRHPRLDRESNTINMKFKNANVLITGGASGIGKIMGRRALQKGAKCFIIWDINLQGIEAT